MSQGRKISLTGNPMPDVAQHQEGESDFKPEHTHVDALTLDLIHDTTDIHVPVGTDQLALEVRRTLAQEVWETVEGLPLEKHADKPFGPCWKSTICPYVHSVHTLYNIKYTVTDHMGRSYSFSKYPTGFDEQEQPEGYEQYKDLTTTQSALSMQGVTFEYNQVGNDEATLTLPNGSVLEYSLVVSGVHGGAYPGTSVTPGHDFLRLEKVTDRYGHTLIYSYVDGDATIPYSIKSSATQQELLITVTNKGTEQNPTNRVEKVEDPMGNEINYTYNSSNLLHQVIRPNASTTTYTYVESVESDKDYSQLYARTYKHLMIDSLKDANNNTYSFTFSDPERYYCGYSSHAGSFNRMAKCGIPYILKEIDLPDNQSSVYFAEFKDTVNLSGIYNTNTVNGYELKGRRENFVTNVNGEVWSYYFSDPVGCDPSYNDYLRVVWTFEYGQLTITAPDSAGTEKYYFDRLPGMDGTDGLKLMAAVSNISWSGSTTEYAYGHFDSEEMWDSCSKPSSETNALEGVKSYGYINQFGWQVQSVTNELGQITAYGFDEYGNRTSQTNYAATTGNPVLSITEMQYNHSDFTNFMTRKIVVDLDYSGVSNLVTTYGADEYGKVAYETNYPNGTSNPGIVTTYDYDANNNLIYVKDPEGNVVTNGYDQLNRLVEIAFFEGSNTNVDPQCTKQFWYDKRSNKTWEKDENDHYTFFQYDCFNNLTNTVRVMDYTSFTPPTTGLESYTPGSEDIVSSAEYNPDGTLSATVDPRGLRTEFEYDALQRLTNTVAGVGDPGEQVTSCEYAGNCGALTLPPYKFLPTIVTDPRGYTTTNVYDKLSRLVETWAAVDLAATTNAVTKNSYDAVGNLHVVSNLVGTAGGDLWQVTTNHYDGLNRLVKVVNPDNTEIGIRYTSTGFQWQTTNELDRVATVEYDLAGRPVKTKSPVLADSSQAVVETGYDDNGNVWWVEDANGNITTNLYDYRNRLVETIAPAVVTNWTTFATAQPTITTIYDGVGNVISVTDAEGNTTTNFYDAANRMFATWAPEVNVYGVGNMRPTTTNTFDKAGNIITTRDANGNEVEMQYDLFSRLTNTVDAVGNTIAFEYDKNGNQTALTDGNDNTTAFVYDGLNRKTSTVYPDDNHEDAEYDLVGNRTKRIDCNGVATTYAYDDRNRLEEVTYPDSRTRDYLYDLAGNLTNVTESADVNAEVSYAYDALNRVISKVSVGIAHEYKYDLAGNRTNAVYGITEREVDWEYDALNRITNIVEGANETAYGYDLNSKPVYRKYPTDVEELRTFDAMGRLRQVETCNLADSGVFIISYHYDAVGSALRMEVEGSVTNTTTTWEYDDRYRLTCETVRETGAYGPLFKATTYTWDSADNRLSMTNETSAGFSGTIYSNNSLNQMTGWSNATTSVAYSYDANGARTNQSVTVGGTTEETAYTYDEDNRLIEVSDGTTTTHEFKYDYRSRRYFRGKPNASYYMYSVFDGGLSIQEYEPSTINEELSTSNLRTEFIRGEGMGGGVGGMVYSIKDDGSGGDEIICSHANHRGDVIARTDNNGSLTYFALYEAYGTRPYEWGDDPDRQKANTKEEETDLNLLNEHERYRCLETGVFLTRDPIGYRDGPNVYCYVHCNPITRFDAWGLDQDEVNETYEQMDEAAENAQETWDDYKEAAGNEDDKYNEYQEAKDAYEADKNGDTKKSRDRAKADWRKAGEKTDSAAERHQAASDEFRKAAGNFRTALADHRTELERSGQIKVVSGVEFEATMVVPGADQRRSIVHSKSFIGEWGGDGLHSYNTRPDGIQGAFELGGSVSAVFAWGKESDIWGGQTRSWGGSLFGGQFTYFYSPEGEGNWRGISFGFSPSMNGGGYKQTYTFE